MTNEALTAIKATPLEWRTLDNGTAWSKMTAVGLMYQATPHGWLHRNGSLNATDGIDAAKAAAEDDYQARIISAIDHQSLSSYEEMERRGKRMSDALKLGDQLANSCFNLSQSGSLGERQKSTLKGLSHQWDAARREIRALSPSGEAK